MNELKISIINNIIKEVETELMEDRYLLHGEKCAVKKTIEKIEEKLTKEISPKSELADVSYISVHQI